MSNGRAVLFVGPPSRAKHQNLYHMSSSTQPSVLHHTQNLLSYARARDILSDVTTVLYGFVADPAQNNQLLLGPASASPAQKSHSHSYATGQKQGDSDNMDSFYFSSWIKNLRARIVSVLIHCVQKSRQVLARDMFINTTVWSLKSPSPAAVPASMT